MSYIIILNGKNLQKLTIKIIIITEYNLRKSNTYAGSSSWIFTIKSCLKLYKLTFLLYGNIPATLQLWSSNVNYA